MNKLKQIIEWKKFDKDPRQFTFNDWVEFYEKNNIDVFDNFLVALKDKYSFEDNYQFHTDVAWFSSDILKFETQNDWDEGQEIVYIYYAKIPNPFEV